jgi:hypothetical protein
MATKNQWNFPKMRFNSCFFFIKFGEEGTGTVVIPLDTIQRFYLHSSKLMGSSLTLYFAVIIVHGRTVKYRLHTKYLVLASSIIIGDESTVEIPWPLFLLS